MSETSLNEPGSTTIACVSRFDPDVSYETVRGNQVLRKSCSIKIELLIRVALDTRALKERSLTVSTPTRPGMFSDTGGGNIRTHELDVALFPSNHRRQWPHLIKQRRTFSNKPPADFKGFTRD